MGKRKIPEFLTIEEQQALINVFNVRYYNSYKNKIMIELFLSTGLRLAEMINLRWRDINLTTGQLKVVEGKGGKDRILWIGMDMLDKLKEYRVKQAEKTPSTSYVFVTNTNNQLDPKSIRKMVITYSEKAGITKSISPHTLRHTYATDLLRATKNIRLVQKALGHSDLSTTMIYTHIVDDEYEDALKNFRR